MPQGGEGYCYYITCYLGNIHSSREIQLGYKADTSNIHVLMVHPTS